MPSGGRKEHAHRSCCFVDWNSSSAGNAPSGLQSTTARVHASRQLLFRTFLQAEASHLSFDRNDLSTRPCVGGARRWTGLDSGAGARVCDLAKFSTSRGNEAHFSQANRNHSRGPRVPGHRGKSWSELASWRRIFLPLPATS